MMVQYEWKTFSLTFEPETGTVTTYYSNWQYSRVQPDDSDALHATGLGLTPELHKLAHELAHHLLALYYGHDSSPVIWCSAHHYDPPTDSWNEERGVNALVYSTFTEARAEDLPCIEAFSEAGIRLQEMQGELRFLMSAAQQQRGSGPTISLR